MGKMQDNTGIPAAVIPFLNTALSGLGAPMQALNDVTNTLQDGSLTLETKVMKVANQSIKAIGAKEDVKGMQEPFKGGENSTDQSAVAGAPERQAVSLETANQLVLPAGITVALGALTTLISGLVFAFTKGGGILQMLNGLAALAQNAGDNPNGLGQTAPQIQQNLAQAMTAAGRNPDDLKSNNGVAQALKDVVVPPTPGLNNAPQPLSEYLPKVLNKMPVLGVPERPKVQAGTDEKTTVVQTPNGTKTVTVGPQLPQTDTQLVSPNQNTPPKVDLVSTNGLRFDPDPYKTLGNPAASLQNAVALAADITAVAGAQKAVASAAADISDAADKFAKGDYTASLALSLRSIIKGLATYNLQYDETMSLPSSTGRSLRWWDQYLPPPSVLDPAIAAKLANGQLLSPSEISAYNNAMQTLSSTAVQATAAERQFPSFPGTAVYAALQDDPYSGTLDDLITEIPERVAVKEGLSNNSVALIHSLIYDYGSDDDRITEIPDILMGADPRIQQFSPGVKRWIKTVDTFQKMTQAEVDQLQTYVAETGSGPLSFVDQVRALSLKATGLYDKLLHDRLLLSQRLELDDVVAFWDSLVPTIDPELPEDQGAKDFLREVVAARDLLGGQPLSYALDQIRQATYSIGGPLGAEMAYMIGVISSLLRASELLDHTPFTVQERTVRTKVLLGHADTMSQQVQNFPNPGLCGRLKGAL